MTSLGIAQLPIKGKYLHPDNFSISICSCHHEKYIFYNAVERFQSLHSLHHLFQSHVQGNHSPLAFSPSLCRDLENGSSSSQRYHFSQWLELLQTRNVSKSLDRSSFK